MAPLSIQPRYITAAAIERLTATLRLPLPDPYVQDWDIECADATRLDEFLDAYVNQPVNDDERFALMSLIVASYDDLLSGGKLKDYLPWGRIRPHLYNEFDLHGHTVQYWSLLDDEDVDNVFAVTPLVREVWNTRLRFPTGVPEFRDFGLLSLGLIGGGEFTNAPEAITAVAAALCRPACFEDADGFTDEITAGTVSRDGNRVAWVQCRSRHHDGGYVEVSYRLRMQEIGRAIRDWEVETYNPYFGCNVGYMGWRDDRVIMVYREKHYTYVISAPPSGTVTRVKIADEWMVSGDQITYRDTDRPTLVPRISLPTLGQLEPLSVAAARAIGLLPHNFDIMTEQAGRRR